MSLDTIMQGTKKALGRTLATALTLGTLLAPGALAQNVVPSEQGSVPAPTADQLVGTGQIRPYSHGDHVDYMLGMNASASFLGPDVDEQLDIPAGSGIRVIAPDGSYRLRSNVSKDDRANYALLIPMDVPTIYLDQGNRQGPAISTDPNTPHALAPTAYVMGPDGKLIGWIAYVSLDPGAPTRNHILAVQGPDNK